MAATDHDQVGFVVEHLLQDGHQSIGRIRDAAAIYDAPIPGWVGGLEREFKPSRECGFNLIGSALNGRTAQTENAKLIALLVDSEFVWPKELTSLRSDFKELVICGSSKQRLRILESDQRIVTFFNNRPATKPQRALDAQKRNETQYQRQASKQPSSARRQVALSRRFPCCGVRLRLSFLHLVNKTLIGEW